VKAVLSQVSDLLHNNKKHEALDLLKELNEVDIASELEDFGDEDSILIFRLLPKAMAADVFAYLSPERQQTYVSLLTDPELAYIVNDLYSDDAVDFVEELPASVVKRVLAVASEETRTQINQLLQYPEDSAGTVMTTEFVGLKRNMTVADAFGYIRRHGMDKETIYTCYVTDEKRVLEGVVTVKMLIFATENQRLGEIMDENVIFAYAMDEREDVADKVRKYDIHALPVVDNERRLVGIVTVDDVIEIVEQENTEDFHLMAAMKPSDEMYLKTGVLLNARRRLPWLVILMLAATVSGMIISSFEQAFVLIPALVQSIPMLMNTGGSAGSQSSTLIIRGMALGELSAKNWIRVVWKEMRIGLLAGALLGGVNIVRLYLMGSDITLALTVSITLLVTVILAKSFGSMLPLIAKGVGIDPALMASPLITTIVDAGSLVVYFSVARILLGL
jgi:magnesium transporter